MICEHCQNEIPDDVHVCNKCKGNVKPVKEQIINKILWHMTNPKISLIIKIIVVFIVIFVIAAGVKIATQKEPIKYLKFSIVDEVYGGGVPKSLNGSLYLDNKYSDQVINVVDIDIAVSGICFSTIHTYHLENIIRSNNTTVFSVGNNIYFDLDLPTFKRQITIWGSDTSVIYQVSLIYKGVTNDKFEFDVTKLYYMNP
jgi:uncharacterized membrane protein